ncbi:MAG: TIGR00725 family protein [candidate division WOR-3 bacterium]
MKGIIAVVGPSKPDEKTKKRAYIAGRAIAEAGFILATGGLGGAMAHASRGAKKAGGTVIGVLPGRDPKKANRFVDIVLGTGLGGMRNFLLVNISRAVVAVGMSTGTLTEVSWALRKGIPIFGFMPPYPGLEMPFSEDEEDLRGFLRKFSDPT